MSEIPGSYQRWRAAEESGRDDDADWAFKTVFQTVVPTAPIPAAFTTRTMEAIAAASGRDARRARHTRAAVVSGTVMGGAAALYFGTGWAISFLSTVFVGFLNLIIAVIVRGAGAVDTGAGFWTVMGSLGQAVAAFVADPKVTVAILVVQAIAIAALVALQRLLGSDRESFE
jgi:hypothetical protein